MRILSDLLREESEANDWYSQGKNDIRCTSIIKNDINKLKEMIKDYPPTYVYLCDLDEDNQLDYLKQVKDKCPYALFELALLCNLEEEKLKYLNSAKDENILSAYLNLSDYYQQNRDIEKQRSILEEAGSKGFMIAYYKLGNIYKNTDKKLSDEFYEKNILSGSVKNNFLSLLK